MDDIYSAPKASLELPNREVTYAGFWIRTAASLIDTIWLLAITFMLAWFTYGASYFDSTEFIQGYGDFLISYILPFILTILFWYYKSATPGKMILGLKIVDSDTFGKVSKGRLIGRYLGYYLSMLGLFMGFFWIAWDKKKQGWHDKLARTVVIKQS
jgi:uncharacterized RDD family membrane protein YckC